MRRLMITCLATLLMLGGARLASASDGFEELVQLVRAGVGERTVVDYVNASTTAYALTEDEILYLSDLGLSTETIEAINLRGRTLGAPAPGAGEPAPTVTTLLEQAGIDGGATTIEGIVEPPAEAFPAQDVVQETVVAPPVVTAPPAGAVDYSTFYAGLAPYGNWVNLEGEWLWQPTAVLTDPAWSPYCQRGRWVYSDCGWVWQSSYSWGWAPFHYGRWRHHSRYGWVWRPDRVWGPAWVCWRFSDSAIGWAPLPPEATYANEAGLCYNGRPVMAGFDFGLNGSAFTFVPVERFCESSLARHRYPRPQAEQIFLSASIRQNRIAIQDGRLRNFGPPVTRIASATRQEIRPVTVVDQNTRAGAPILRTKILGATLTIFRPSVTPIARATPRQVVVQNEAREWERHKTTLLDEVFHPARNVTVVQVEQMRGRESREAQPGFVRPTFVRPAYVTPVYVTPIPAPTPGAIRIAPAISAAMDFARQEQQRLAEEAARQRQAEEAAARQREAQRRRADEMIQQQNAAHQQAQELARQQALAEQQHRAADFARQQEAQRQAHEAERQQAQQREAAAAVRAAEEQRQALRAQRMAEEAAARQRDEQARPRHDVAPVVQPVLQPPPATLPNYSDPATTGADSNRGNTSRGNSGSGTGRRPFGR